VFIFKPEMGFIVIEVLHPLYIVKGFLGMALPAILSKKIVMHIFMAIRAICKPDPCKFLHLDSISGFQRMAFKTFNLLVLSR
jgi:hypothetical protein